MEFEVVFSGNVCEGINRRQAIRALADNFLLTFTQIRRLLARRNLVVKRFSGRKEGENLVILLLNSGWKAELRVRGEIVFPVEQIFPPVLTHGNKLDANDRSCSLNLPHYWHPQEGLNDCAVLQAGNQSHNEFLIVLRQCVNELVRELSLEDYCTAQLRQCASRLVNGAVCSPAASIVGAKIPACSGEVSAEIDGVSVRYSIACLKAGNSIFTLFFWCEYAEFDRLRPVFSEVAGSLSVAADDAISMSAGLSLLNA